MNHLIKISALLTISIMASTPVFAIPVVGGIDIDFRTSEWGAGNYQNSVSVGDTTVRVVRPGNGELWWDDRDGFGIRGGENDEIDHKERLLISFANEINLEGVWITDLFDAPDGHRPVGEVGWVKVFFGDDRKFDEKEVFFGRDSNQRNGEQFISFDTDWDISWVKFGANRNSGNEFSIAGFEVADVTPVPTPASILLMGLGLIGISISRRRKA